LKVLLAAFEACIFLDDVNRVVACVILVGTGEEMAPNWG